MTSVPDLAEPVAGWRVWDLAETREGPLLVSPLRPVFWPPRRPMTATCSRGCAPSPSLPCRCGLYAMDELPRLHRESRGQGRVVGCTALWGRVVEHAHGFRAQFAYPLLLFLLPAGRPGVSQRLLRRRPLPDVGYGLPAATEVSSASPAEPARRLKQHYGVPVVVPSGSPADGYFPDDRLAGAVAAEAVRGLAGRREGDHTAHARFADAVEDLVGRRW
ncbi:hypothetical protein [Actinomycetospora termitidis]|uniref:Uncharacterized protein n=1 Tax=Actinomycetospora termitidis TaxID=3053470 RepID=A0ABT7MA93_9PSEU|nr:hypothetical protein [Actinomycetospora sp. Odt1-22]MDL5157584.1 hypothetical protein [Actinomycetospora sp. Odt1-22]